MKYVALLRGIGPGNPNMRNENLREVFEGLGFQKVQSVISSGNIIFESNRSDIKQMEAELEAAWTAILSFTSTTIIKSQQEIQTIAKANPFEGMIHGPASYLLVTFSKRSVEFKQPLPYQPSGKTYRVIGKTKNVVFTTTDNRLVKTTDLMTWLEKELGKEITSRTWLTVQRILKRMK